MMQRKNSSHRKKSGFPPYVTHDETKVAVRLRLPPDGAKSYGIIDTKQQPQQNQLCCLNSTVFATFVQ